MDDNLPNPKTADTPKSGVGFIPASPPPLDPMTPPDDVQIEPVPLPSVTALPEHPVPPASPSQGGPASPPAPPLKPPVAFAEEPVIKPPSSAPAHVPQEKNGKTGGGKKVIAGIAALVLLVAALAGGIYLVGVPGSGELRRKAENTSDINATMTVTSSELQYFSADSNNGCHAGGDKYWVLRYTCDDVKPVGIGCQDNEDPIERNVTGSGGSYGFNLSRTCGTQQIDLGCEGMKNVPYLKFLTYYGPATCGAVASPTPAPALGTCGTPCNLNDNCGGGLSCTCSDLNATSPCGVCWNDNDTQTCGGNETPTPVPTSTPGPSPTPGAGQCIDVRSQTQSAGSWVDSDLSVARVGDNIRFVARVSATVLGVSFRITSGTGAPQTVAGTLLTSGATTKEYAAEYTIPASGQLSVVATVQ